jgi:aspartate/methionine/tyrosine aminotransferase
LFECLATLDAVHVIEYSLPEERGWAIDFDALERVRTPRSRAVVVVNPNNPTGAFLKRREWLRLQRWAAERGLAIIADEVFADYGYGVETGSGVLMWTHQSVPAPDAATGRVSSFEATGEALVFTLSGLSKVAGLPQMKLGWVHASGPDDVVQHALERLEWIADAYLPVSAPVQHAAARWLELAPSIQHAIAERCLVNLSTARTAFGAACGARALPAEGGWCVVLDMPRLYGEEEWTLRLLERAGVLLQPGFFYDYEREALLVASLLVEPATFADGLKRVEHTLLEA